MRVENCAELRLLETQIGAFRLSVFVSLVRVSLSVVLLVKIYRFAKQYAIDSRRVALWRAAADGWRPWARAGSRAYLAGRPIF